VGCWTDDAINSKELKRLQSFISQSHTSSWHTPPPSNLVRSKARETEGRSVAVVHWIRCACSDGPKICGFRHMPGDWWGEGTSRVRRSEEACWSNSIACNSIRWLLPSTSAPTMHAQYTDWHSTGLYLTFSKSCTHNLALAIHQNPHAALHIGPFSSQFWPHAWLVDVCVWRGSSDGWERQTPISKSVRSVLCVVFELPWLTLTIKVELEGTMLETFCPRSISVAALAASWHGCCKRNSCVYP